MKSFSFLIFSLLIIFLSSVVSSVATFSSNVTINVPSIETSTTPPAGGSGENSKSVGEIEPFSLDKDLIKVRLKQGETIRDKLVITNNLSEILETVNIKIEFVGKFMALNKNSFSLPPKSSESIIIDFFAREDELPDVYTGHILVTSRGVTKIVNIIIEVKSKKPLFDLSSNIEDSSIVPGQRLDVDLQMKNIGDFAKVDVFLEYFIKDFEDNEIKIGGETLGVEGRLNIKREFVLPKNIKLGDYVFIAKLHYANETAVSSNSFTLSEDTRSAIKISLILIITIIVIVIAGFIIFWKRRDSEVIQKKSNIIGGKRKV